MCANLLGVFLDFGFFFLNDLKAISRHSSHLNRLFVRMLIWCDSPRACWLARSSYFALDSVLA